MIVFKLSWLPWILIIAGVALLADGEAPGVVLLIIGVVWLFLKLRSKSKNSVSSKGQSTPPKASSVKPVTKCSRCGKENRPGSIFCENCGSKLS